MDVEALWGRPSAVKSLNAWSQHVCGRNGVTSNPNLVAYLKGKDAPIDSGKSDLTWFVGDGRAFAIEVKAFVGGTFSFSALRQNQIDWALNGAWRDYYYVWLWGHPLKRPNLRKPEHRDMEQVWLVPLEVWLDVRAGCATYHIDPPKRARNESLVDALTEFALVKVDGVWWPMLNHPIREGDV